MAINRFYNPAQSQYVSQFVPEELPADLMLNILSKKQAIQDDFTRNATLLADWNQKALVGDDTAKIEAIRAKNQEFYNQIGSMNFTDPNAQKMYFQHVRDIKNNKDIQRIAAAYEHDQAMMELEKKQKETGNYAHSKAQWDLYYKQRAQHTTPGSKGALGDQSITGITPFRGVDVTGELLKVFNVTKGDHKGYMQMMKTLDGMLAHASKYGGISLDKLDDQEKLFHSQIMQGDIGRELTAQFDNGYFDENVSPLYAKQRMSEEEKTEYNEKLNLYVTQEAKNAAYLLRYDDIDESTKAAAYNQGAASAKTTPVVAEVTVPGSKTGDVNAQQDFGKYNNNTTEIARNNTLLKQMNEVITLRNAGQKLTPEQEKIWQQSQAKDSETGLPYVKVLALRNKALSDENAQLETRATNAFSKILKQEGGANAPDVDEYLFGFNSIMKDPNDPKHKTYKAAWDVLTQAANDENDSFGLKGYVTADPNTNPDLWATQVLRTMNTRGRIPNINEQDIEYLVRMGKVHGKAMNLANPERLDSNAETNAWQTGAGIIAFPITAPLGATGGALGGFIAWMSTDKPEASALKQKFDEYYNQAGTSQSVGVILDPTDKRYVTGAGGQKIPKETSAIGYMMGLFKKGDANFSYTLENGPDRGKPVDPMLYDFDKATMVIEDQSRFEENDGNQIWTITVPLKNQYGFPNEKNLVQLKIEGPPGNYTQLRRDEQVAEYNDPNTTESQRAVIAQNLIRRSVSPSVNQQVVTASTMKPGDYHRFATKNDPVNDMFIQRNPKIPEQYFIWSIPKGYKPYGNPTDVSFKWETPRGERIDANKPRILTLPRITDLILKSNGYGGLKEFGLE